MSRADRDESIDAYFATMDETDLEIVRPHLADDFVYESLSGDLHGFEGLKRYMEEFRSVSNTTHEITLRVHEGDVTVTEGTLTADTDDGGLDVRFCNVFEFDEDDRISRLAVYLNDS